MTLLSMDVMTSPHSTAMVLMAATNWFSVRDDMNSPTAIKQLPMRSMPTVQPMIFAQFGSLYAASTQKYGIVSTRVDAKSVSAAKNFASTIPVRLTGDVISSCSVRDRFSSEKDFTFNGYILLCLITRTATDINFVIRLKDKTGLTVDDKTIL